MSSYVIREVEPHDAEQIGIAHVAIWKTTYPGMVNQAKLEALDAQQSTTRWTQIIGNFAEQTSRGIRTRCAVLTDTEHIVGFATGGTPRDDDAPASVELWSLNVVPRYHGTGVAKDLMNEVLGEGGIAAYLWVATGNARAVGFYRKHGFELDGATRFDPDWDCNESRMTTT